MEIPYSWLKEQVPLLPEPKRVADDLGRLGYEVANTTLAEEGFGPVVLARVVARSPHPDSDHLSLVTVNAGPNRIAQVVTGASNGFVGDKVWWGPPGTVLPDGRRLEEAMLRGIKSPGMLMSHQELGYRGGDEDLWIWTGPEEPGATWAEVMGTDPVYELELTPNLAQFAQSAIGVARDLAALYRVTPPALPDPYPASPGAGLVAVEDPAACPRYALWAVEVDQGHLPWAHQRRLKSAGFRLISPVVDATNYVLMDLGQPLHAFDRQKVALPIVVRKARPGEQMTLLDGTEVTLEPEDLVIADQVKVLALAGIMGGKDSGIDEATRSVLVESAHFAPAGIYRTARRLGLMTDAALRFSRGTDPGAVRPALARMAALLEAASALKEAGPAEVVGSALLPPKLPWQPERLRGWLGVDWDDERLASDLKRLGFAVKGSEVAVPTFRPDIEGGQDLAEEVGRLEGMDAIPVRVPRRSGVARLDPEVVQADRVRDFMAAAGYTEVLTRSFIEPGLASQLGLREGVHRLRNPLREEESVLRPDLLPSLLLTARYNRDRGAASLAIFEVGRIYGGSPEAPEESLQLGGLLTLSERPALHGSTSASVYDLKGAVEELSLVMRWSLALQRDSLASFLHPGRSLSIWADGRVMGYVGELHPAVQDEWRLSRTGVILLNLPAPHFELRRSVERPSRYPAVDRDMSLVIPPGLDWNEVDAVIRRHGDSMLTRVVPFDQYVGEFGRSVTVRLEFRAPDRTLTEEEVERSLSAILAALGGRGVQRRG